MNNRLFNDLDRLINCETVDAKREIGTQLKNDLGKVLIEACELKDIYIQLLEEQNNQTLRAKPNQPENDQH